MTTTKWFPKWFPTPGTTPVPERSGTTGNRFPPLRVLPAQRHNLSPGTTREPVPESSGSGFPPYGGNRYQTCPECGSDRVIEGPFYNRSATRCMNCGHTPDHDKPHRRRRP